MYRKVHRIRPADHFRTLSSPHAMTDIPSKGWNQVDSFSQGDPFAKPPTHIVAVVRPGPVITLLDSPRRIACAVRTICGTRHLRRGAVSSPTAARRPARSVALQRS